MTAAPHAKAGPLTFALLTMIVLFGLGDLFAELHTDGRTGKYGETVSTFIHHLEVRRWYVRALVLSIMLDLSAHLAFGTSLTLVGV